MRGLAILLALASVWTSGCSCGNDAARPDSAPDASSDNTFDQCDGDPASFVRQSFLALAGRRPRSQAEVDVYVDLYAAATELGDDPRDVVARAIMQRPEFSERWVEVVMDALHVQRIDVQSEASCWDDSLRPTVSPALAQTIRDQSALQMGDGQPWTMLDLARSAIALDDLTPIHRAQLFSMMSHPIPAANVPRVEAELARREDFGATFDAAYLHRDVVCLGCHTSESSVTDSDDPALDRHWPVPGAPEAAVYGKPMGIAAERAHAAFRVDGFVDSGSARPWGWAGTCGTFRPPGQVGTDPAGVDGKLASITGMHATVYDVEAALARGFAALRGTGVADGATIADPDTALAWLVTLKITEDVWKQATGTSLTIANYFPRNEASAQLLYELANTFAREGFSLKALLVAIVSSDYFDRLPPEAGCGPSPYIYPNVFDPWVIAEADPARRLNGPGDAVTAVNARTLLSALSAALEWSAPPGGSRFPDFGEGCEDVSSCSALSGLCQSRANACCLTYQVVCEQGGVHPAVEVPFQRSVGVFLRNSERGFRGLDFQARLAWEDRHGACARPGWVAEDFIDRLVAAGAADGTASARDLVAALKDRLVGEPAIDDGAERDALTAIVGSLDAPASAVSASALRRVCGALLGSPQFLLQGIAGRGGERPKLTPASAGYDAVCAEIASAGVGVPEREVTCGETLELTVAAARTERAPEAAAEPPRTDAVRVRRPLPPARTPAPTRHR